MLCELNYMGNTLKVEYNFGGLFKYFPFPYEIRAENNNATGAPSLNNPLFDFKYNIA